jgi:hypothetical protein
MRVAPDTNSRLIGVNSETDKRYNCMELIEK